MANSLRTPLGKVRGLGAAGHGVGHFIQQRVSAVAMLFLLPWFFYHFLRLSGEGYSTAEVWLSHPVNAVLTLLTALAVSVHMRLGLQTVIEDYIAKAFTRNLLLILNAFAAITIFFLCGYVILRIGL